MVKTILLLIMSCLSMMPLYADYTVLHNFGAGSDGDGQNPNGSLILVGDTFYGMTSAGGLPAYNGGTIFSIGPTGSGYTILYKFGTGGMYDGHSPFGDLTYDPDTNLLYGMTSGGGTNGVGIIFSISPSGTNYTILHDFDTSGSGGDDPQGSLLLVSGTLYGMTIADGTNGQGTIFSYNIMSTTYTPIHSFPVNGNDGENPQGSLIYDPDTNLLYGMTTAGGASSHGIIFSCHLDGSNYTVLHTFAGAPGDGSAPDGDLTLVGSTLYGTTSTGGSNGNNGTIFSCGLDGSNYTILHNFPAVGGDGVIPRGSLIYDTDTNLLYGMTTQGGADSGGIIFSMSPNGGNYTILHAFDGSTGSDPSGALLLDTSNNRFYGMTTQGGTNSTGVVFSASFSSPPTPLSPPSSGSGQKIKNRFALEVEWFNRLRWVASTSSGVVGYNVHRNGVLIASDVAGTEYTDYNRPKNGEDIYTITSVNGSGSVSSSALTILVN
jgi:uncharacterized repeat protein (TIGR03803 family)